MIFYSHYEILDALLRNFVPQLNKHGFLSEATSAMEPSKKDGRLVYCTALYRAASSNPRE